MKLSHIFQIWKDMPTKQFQVNICVGAATLGLVNFYWLHSVLQSLVSITVFQSLDVLVPFDGGHAMPAVGGKRFCKRKVRRGRENDLHEMILPRRWAIGTPSRRSAAVATSR